MIKMVGGEKKHQTALSYTFIICIRHIFSKTSKHSTKTLKSNQKTWTILFSVRISCVFVFFLSLYTSKVNYTDEEFFLYRQNKKNLPESNQKKEETFAQAIKLHTKKSTTKNKYNKHIPQYIYLRFK